ncbi:FAD-dependent monooxygenase [Chishuiella sp.]|uniref:FAD-dependent monooxygenase n=1 Tax=Chishuiella sp. TaxID=1969467 RepID=UPI0028A9BDEA|nr:FAD-dependent monooxygenase [Chishuiella sp.]
MPKKFLIAGAGIAGLTLAKVLQDLNYDFELFESSEKVRGIGAGFGLASNAMKAFEILGLSEEVVPLGHMLKDFEIQDWKGKTILKADTERLINNYNNENFAVHRADLHEFLVSKINPTKIKTNKKVTFFEQSYEKVVLHFTDGSSIEGDFLISADGINSVIRQQLLKHSTPRYAGYICWRSIVEDKSYESKKSIETWGANGRFGLTPLINNKIYWYACVNTPLNSSVYNYKLDDIQKHFKDYSGQIRNVLQKTNPEKIITTPIMDIKPINNYVFNRVLLIGDAAHATTPNMGQGACMAIEDVCVLFDELVKKDTDILSAFEGYNQRRLKRTHYIIDTSRLAGKVAQIENKFLIAIRNFAFRSLPKSITQSPLEDLLEEDFMKK